MRRFAAAATALAAWSTPLATLPAAAAEAGKLSVGADLDVDVALSAAAAVDVGEDECAGGASRGSSSGGGPDADSEGACSVGLLQLRASRQSSALVQGQGFAGAALDEAHAAADAASSEQRMRAQLCPAPNKRCPEGKFLCTAGPAVNGCFDAMRTTDPGQCSAFATVPCGAVPQSITSPASLPGPQSSRLRITNGCASEPMWIAHMVGKSAGPDTQDRKLAPGASFDFTVQDGMASTRYWPKLGCNEAGSECVIGGSGGPGEQCNPEHGCAPPLDTKFEATWGIIGRECSPATGRIAGCDWLDISLVDGFTVPFKVEVDGQCNGLAAMDCSGLTLGKCPADLLLRSPISGAPAGCYSPCAKLTYPHYHNPDGRHTPWDDAAVMQCCPTPPVSPAQCQSGPVASSPFVSLVHGACPGVYAYAYDDAEGLSTCTAGAKYHVTFFCPG